MHILIGFLGLVVTIVVLLNRLADAGIDLGGLNPFMRRRRRNWQEAYAANPLFSIDKPLEAAAVLVVWTAKCDGDISAEQKRVVLGIFEETFKLDGRQASDLLGSSVHLIGDGQILRMQLGEFLERIREQLNDDQVESTLSLMDTVSRIEGEPTVNQRALMVAVSDTLGPDSDQQGTWGSQGTQK